MNTRSPCFSRTLLLVALVLFAIGLGSEPVCSQSPAHHWSFVQPRLPSLPSPRQPHLARNPIDQFILSALQKQGLELSPEAGRATLIRRLSLDLRGLPPSVDEVTRFLQDNQEDAFEQLVNRMLASPQFGEHWGRHWLDLARYADSDGYEKDSARPYAFLYRDWVVAAINRDLPFDEFSLEQLAGDLLPAASPSNKVATGFHRNTLTNREGGVDEEEFRCKAVVDRVNTTATVWLGLTVGCAECHDHKYDPITQRDYYQLYAFFNNASEKDLPMPRPGEWDSFLAAKQKWNQERSRLERALKVSGVTENTKPTDLEKALKDHEKRQPQFAGPRAQILADEPGLRKTHIHIRGDFLRPGDEVHPSTPTALHPLRTTNAAPTRLDLAHWLFDSTNPLTARVVVNRVWHHLFGQGLVPTVNDFGARGEKPSHPELLDWLALEFHGMNWSRKDLIRLIVQSGTYRQSSNMDPELARLDPNNRLLARQNRFRLEAETIRDAALSVSGLLNTELGGPGIRPPLPADIAALGYADSVQWKQSEGSDVFRRGLYIFFQRTVPYPMLVTFDAPDSNITCARRERSNTPLQALTLLNDPVFWQTAQALARRIGIDLDSQPDDAIRLAFNLCLTRQPTREELQHLRDLYDHMCAALKQDPSRAGKIAGQPLFNFQIPGKNVATAVENSASLCETQIRVAALTSVARAILNLDEFLTRN